MNKQYIYSERINLTCPRMIVGMKFDIVCDFSEERIREAIEKLSSIHTFLRSNIKKDANGYYYDIKDDKKIEIYIKNAEENFIDDYSKFADDFWDIQNGNMFKVCAYPSERYFTVLFLIHHIISDGRALMCLVKDFVKIYNYKEVDLEKEPKVIRSIKDFPKKSDLSFPNKIFVTLNNFKWYIEKNKVNNIDYKNFFVDYMKKNKTGYNYFEFTKEETYYIENICRKNKVTVNSAILTSLFKISPYLKSIGVAVDIRKKLNYQVNDTLGNFASGIRIEYSYKNQLNFFENAKLVNNKVKKKISKNRDLFLLLSCYMRMNPNLIDAMNISAFGYFKSDTAKKISGSLGHGVPSGLGVTNLGREFIDKLEDVVFIPPSVPSNELTIGVVTVNGKMSIVLSYSLKFANDTKVNDTIKGLKNCLLNNFKENYFDF